MPVCPNDAIEYPGGDSGGGGGRFATRAGPADVVLTSLRSRPSSVSAAAGQTIWHGTVWLRRMPSQRT